MIQLNRAFFHCQNTVSSARSRSRSTFFCTKLRIDCFQTLSVVRVSYFDFWILPCSRQSFCPKEWFLLIVPRRKTFDNQKSLPCLSPSLLSIKKEQETTFVLLPLSQGQIPERSRFILALLPIISRTFTRPLRPNDCLLVELLISLLP